MKFIKHQYLFESLGVILFGLLITIIYFAPLFQGKTIPQHDIKQGAASQQELIEFREKTGEEALWTNRMFGGMPLYVTGTRFENNWFEKIAMKFRFLPRTSDAIFLCFLGSFIMLVCFKIRPLIAGIGAFAYAFNTFSMVSVEAGHIFKILAYAYAPVVIGGMALIFRRKEILGFSVLALGVALEITARHYQITYYLAFFGVFYAIDKTIISLFFKNRNEVSNHPASRTHILKSIGLVLLAVVVGIGPNFSRLWSIQEYNKYSTRGTKILTDKESNTDPEKTVKEANQKPTSGLTKDYAFSWSQGKWETMTLFIPGLYGGSSAEPLASNSNEVFQTDIAKKLKQKGVDNKQISGLVKRAPMYWGDQPGTAGPAYAGAIIGFFIVLFFLNLRKNKSYLWLLPSTIILLFISWGNNLEWFNYWMFDHFPLFNKFRSVSMAIVLVMLGMVTMACIGISNLLELDVKERKNQLLKSILIYLGFLISILILTLAFADLTGRSGYPDWLVTILVEERKSMIYDSFFRVAFFSIAAAAVLLLVNKTNMALGYLALLSVVDLGSMDWKYTNYDDYKPKKSVNTISLSGANKAIQKDKGYYRVFDFNNPFNNAITSYAHNSIGGYHGAKMRRYQDLIDRHLSKSSPEVLSMLNTKYIISQEGKPQKTRLENGAVWFVSDVKAVDTPQEEIDYLDNPNFKSLQTAVINRQDYAIPEFEHDHTASIELANYQPNHLTYQSKSNKRQLAVMSEIYYPAGWNAYIDGQKVDYIRANYILRALEIPSGSHTIEFKFEPKSYYTGEKIALGFSILLCLILIGSFGYSIKKEILDSSN